MSITTVTAIIKDCCEAEPSDPDHPDTICISVSDLEIIVARNLEVVILSDDPLPHNTTGAATMTTTQTERLMALADRYAFHIPGSQHSDEARAALLAALQSAQPVAQPLTDEQIDAFWNQQLTVPQIVQRRVIARAIEAAHGIGGAL